VKKPLGFTGGGVKVVVKKGDVGCIRGGVCMQIISSKKDEEPRERENHKGGVCIVKRRRVNSSPGKSKVESKRVESTIL